MSKCQSTFARCCKLQSVKMIQNDSKCLLRIQNSSSSHSEEVPFVDTEEIKGEAHHLLIPKRAPSWQNQTKERPNQEFSGDQESNEYHCRHQ